MVMASIEFFAAGVAGQGALDGSHPVDRGHAGRARVGIFALHFPAFEREGMVGAFPCDPELGASGFPFISVRGDPPPPAPFVSYEVGELVLQGAPGLIFGKIEEFRVQLDGARRPPRPACSRSHPRVP